jgi:hypothetical protein
VDEECLDVAVEGFFESLMQRQISANRRKNRPIQVLIHWIFFAVIIITKFPQNVKSRSSIEKEKGAASWRIVHYS